MRGVVPDVRQHRTGVHGLGAAQQPLDRGAALARGHADTVLVHLAGGPRGLLRPRGLLAQRVVAGDVGPQGERASLAVVEAGEEGEIGLGITLVRAERVAEFDEFESQHVGLEVVRHDALRDLPPLPRPLSRRAWRARAGTGHRGRPPPAPGFGTGRG